MMKQLIVYDLDGTLVDTLEDITEAANHMLRQMGAPAMSAREVRGYVGQGVHELVRNCLKTEDPARVEEGVRLYRAYYGAHLTDHTRVYPGAKDLLDYFRNRRQAILTNKSHAPSLDLLAALDIAGYFSMVIAGDTDYPKKPDPTSILALMRSAGVAAEAAVFIGDSPIDVETGRRAGVLSVSILHGFSDEDELRAAGAHVLVRDFAELLRLARERGW